MIRTRLAIAVIALRSVMLRARAAFYDTRASWQEGKKAMLPDASGGIESATRHSEVAYEADRSRGIAAELRRRAAGQQVERE